MLQELSYSMAEKNFQNKDNVYICFKILALFIDSMRHEDCDGQMINVFFPKQSEYCKTSLLTIIEFNSAAFILQ